MTQAVQPSLDAFVERDEGGTMYSASLQIVLYAKAPLPELASGAIECYRLLAGKFGSHWKWYHAGSMKVARRFTEKYADIFPTLCLEGGSHLPSFRVFNGDLLADYRPPVFETGYYGVFSWLQVHLSPELATDWKGLLTLLTALATPFPFRYGTVGYSLCWNRLSADRDNEVPKLIGPLLKRYPGFNLGTPGELCDQDIPPVNWLTLLGPELLGRLGGIAKVRRALLEPQISVLPIGHGAFVRAGERPQLGDRNRLDDLPVYRKVGSALNTQRVHQPVRLKGIKDESEAWLARFDA